MISPLCLDGAVEEDEKREALAALMAKFLRHESSVDVSSWISHQLLSGVVHHYENCYHSSAVASVCRDGKMAGLSAVEMPREH